MTGAHIVNEHGQRLGHDELEARIASALAEAQSVLAPGILSSLIDDLADRSQPTRPSGHAGHGRRGR